MHRSAYTGGADFTQYFKDKNWMFNLNGAFSLVEGSRKAIESTQLSSAHYFRRPDNNYSILDTNRTSLAGSGGRMQVLKLNGHWNFQGAVTWKTPGFETNDLVIRWEYNPGSSVYLVWSQTRSSSNSSGNLDLLNDMGSLFGTDHNKPHNVFLIKFSYRFGLK